MQISTTKQHGQLSEEQLATVIEGVRLISRIESRFGDLGDVLERSRVDFDKASFNRVRADLYLFRISLRAKFSDHLKAIVRQGRQLRSEQPRLQVESNSTFQERGRIVSTGQERLVAGLHR